MAYQIGSTKTEEELDNIYIKIKTLGDIWSYNALSPNSEYNHFYEQEKSKIILIY